MIKSFGLAELFEKGSSRKVRQDLHSRILRPFFQPTSRTDPDFGQVGEVKGARVRFRRDASKRLAGF
jgi:hypothetical protein